MMPHNRRGTGTALVARQEESIDLLQKNNELLEKSIRVQLRQLRKLEEIRVILAKEKDK